MSPLNSTEQFINDLDVELESLRALLIEKNRKYGNSALEPLRIASKASPEEALLIRIDDKLSRIEQGDDSEDVWLDLIGYAVILRIARARAKGDKALGRVAWANVNR